MITMADAFFIEGRALSLAYEAVRFPNTAEAAITWLGRARIWASRRNLVELEKVLNAHVIRVGILTK